MADWAWIPLTLWAALTQTFRNAAQRHLIKEVGTLGATLVRFLYGLPFAVVWLGITGSVAGGMAATPNRSFLLWVLLGAVAQSTATALLLRVMAERNFALGVAYSKAEIVLVALFGLLILRDPFSAITAGAIALATVGLLFISSPPDMAPLVGIARGWTSRSAALGIASGACFALAATGYRGASLAVRGEAGTLVAAAYALLWSQALQTVLIGGWLLLRNRAALVGVVREWRTSLTAGFMGAASSVGWFTAMAIEPVAHVRTLGLVEMLFSYAVSRRLFDERSRTAEKVGLVLLTAGLVAVTLGR